MKKVINKIINKFKEKLFVADTLLIASFFIIFITTFILNKFIAMYLLAIFLLAVSYLVQKGGK